MCQVEKIIVLKGRLESREEGAWAIPEEEREAWSVGGEPLNLILQDFNGAMVKITIEAKY